MQPSRLPKQRTLATRSQARILGKNFGQKITYIGGKPLFRGMKVIVNSIIPFPGFTAINLFGFVFVRKEYWDFMSENRKTITLNHESIHTRQLWECLLVFYYPLYLIEWLIRLPFGNAYRNISFEQEAYAHQEDLSYLKRTRRPYNWCSYWFKRSQEKH